MPRFKLVRFQSAFLGVIEGGTSQPQWLIRDTQTGREMRVGCRRIGREILKNLKLAVRSGLLSGFGR